jgi:hypothetical protein
MSLPSRSKLCGEIESDENFGTETPRRLMGPITGLGANTSFGYDVSNDGQRVTALQAVDQSGYANSTTPLVVVENFFNELNRQVTAD